MKQTIKVEEFGMFLLGIVLFNQLDFPWWVFLALILTPDLSMVGYLFNPKVGAVCYNLIHHKAVAIIVYLLGIYFLNNNFQLVGIILFAHSSMDRMFGYGLKYSDSFFNTHLGIIGKKIES